MRKPITLILSLMTCFTSFFIEAKVITLNDNTFNSKIKSGVTVVDFNAVWCGPCKKYSPVFHRVSDKHTDVTFAQVDTDISPKVSDQYHIDRLPTTILFKDGKEIKRVIGPQDEASLEALLRS